MKEIIWATVICVLFFALAVFVYFYIKGINTYRDERNKTMIRNTEEIYINMKIVDGNLLPYHPFHGYDVQHKFGGINTKDAITGVSAKKNFVVVQDKVMYIVNNQLKYPLDIVDKYDRKFIKINDDIKSVEVLISFGTPTHLFFKMSFSKNNEGDYIVTVKQEDIKKDDRTRDTNRTI